MHRQWKQGRVAWEECRNAVQKCREGIKKAKAQKELNLAMDLKLKKVFYRYIGQKRKAQGTISPLKNEKGELVTIDMENVEVLKSSLPQF